MKTYFFAEWFSRLADDSGKMAANESVRHDDSLRRVNHCAIYQQFKFKEQKLCPKQTLEINFFIDKPYHDRNYATL